MRSLIKKILKEQEDDFEWTKDLDVHLAEKEIKKDFIKVTNELNFNGETLYQMLTDSGIHDLEKLKEIGEFVYQQADHTYTYAQDNYDYACDGCCDDMYYYEDIQEYKDDAREEGRQEGKSESEAEIEELRGQINELQDTIEELHNKLTS